MHLYQRSRQAITLVAVGLILATLPVTAAATERPDAGITLGGLQEHKPQPEKPAAGVTVIEQPQITEPEAAGVKVKLNGVRITGQDFFAEDELAALVSDAFGKELTFGELEALAGRISKYFHDQGYLVAGAYLPPQDIKDGIVEIRVLAGRYGKIDIRNHSRLRGKTAAGFFSRLKNGDYITNAPLERALLLLSDTSGVGVKSTLAPGSTPGTADLVVEISDTARTSGQYYADNWGNRFTGKTRAGLSVNMNNADGRGGAFTLGGIYTGSGMNDYDVSYLLPTGGQGAKLGVGYSQMHYALGEDFASLEAGGMAKTFSIYETFAFRRSRDFNLSGRIGYDSRRLQDRIDSLFMDSRKRADVWTLGLNGDKSDNFGGGVTGFGLTFTCGHLSLDSVDALVGDFLAQTAGSYTKTNLNLNREQYLNPRLSLHLFFAGQWTDKNLDSSEKLSIGGANGVRAYPPGEAPGDEGYILTGELRWNLPKPEFQLAAFYDWGKSILNKHPWDNYSVNERILAGAGLGLIWNRPGDCSIRLDYAWKTTSDPATADTDRHGRLWLMGVKYF